MADEGMHLEGARLDREGRTHPRVFYPLVVVGVDADVLGPVAVVVGVETLRHRPQLLVVLEVRPPPDPAVYHMGQALLVRDLEPAVQALGDGDTLGEGAGVGQGILQVFDGAWKKRMARLGRDLPQPSWFRFLIFLTSDSTAFSDHFSSSSVQRQPRSFFTCGPFQCNRLFIKG